MTTENSFSHLDEEGRARMVDVGAKRDTARRAVASCTVRLNQSTFTMLKERALPKGDVLATARIAGIQAAKRTAELIPLCHPVFVSHVDVDFEIDDSSCSLKIKGEARTTGKTGVEMEALVAVQVAALTIYDMCKAVQKDIVLTDCRLLYKSGGKSGVFLAPGVEEPPAE